MDDIDRASELETQQRERALKARQPPDIIGSSRCFDCDDPIPEERRKALPSVIRCVHCQQIHEIWGSK